MIIGQVVPLDCLPIRWHVWFHDITVLCMLLRGEKLDTWIGILCHCDINCQSEFLHIMHKSSTNIGYVVSWCCLGLESRCLGLGLETSCLVNITDIKYKNRPRKARVIIKTKVACFLWFTVYFCCRHLHPATFVHGSLVLSANCAQCCFSSVLLIQLN